MFRPGNLVAILICTWVHFLHLLSHYYYKKSVGFFFICFVWVYCIYPKLLPNISLAAKPYLSSSSAVFKQKSKDSREAYSDPLRKGHRRSEEKVISIILRPCLPSLFWLSQSQSFPKIWPHWNIYLYSSMFKHIILMCKTVTTNK